MGKVLSTVARPFKLYNIEARAHKVISKEKPTVAPSYPYVMKDIQRTDKEDPGFMEKQKMKDVQLDKHLKDIYVVSHDPDPVKKLESLKETKTDRPLPELRSSDDYPEYGYVEPDVNEVPRGKFTLKQAIKFITDHQSQPDAYKAQDIARDYKIDVRTAENVVKHFSMFDFHVPKQSEKEEITLLNYYGKCKEIVENFYKSRPKEFTEKGKKVKETTPSVIRHSDLSKKK